MDEKGKANNVRPDYSGLHQENWMAGERINDANIIKYIVNLNGGRLF